MRMLVILGLGLLLAGPAGAQAPAEEATADAAPVSDDERNRQEMFETVVQRIADLEATIPEVERARKQNRDPAAIEEVNAELADLRAELRGKRADLNRLVSGFDPKFADDVPEGAIRWEDEAQELLSPVLSGIKQATVRPRRIEKLRSRIVHYDDQIGQVRQAVDNATTAMDGALTDDARGEIAEIRGEWLSRQKELDDARKLAQLELNQLQGEAGGFGDASTAFFELFFRSRGRNGLIALAVFLSIFLVVKLLHRALLGSLRLSEQRRNTLGLRLLELAVYVVGTAGALGASLVVLYASGDWVLLTVAAVLLVGLMWGARSALPRFWREVQLLLNVGPVRQGERVVWEGVPWRVRSLHVLTILENPCLPHTHVRLPLGALAELTSRPASDDEPWFPSVIGDWLLWDDRAARGLSQGPEFVVLERDRSRLTLATADFVAAGITNLSQGFRHRVTLTLDYRHQDIATTSAPAALKAHVAAALGADPSGEHLLHLACDFDAASASSLDLEIEADFAGAAADRWEALGELIQAATVDACNAEGWEIALPQLTLHQAAAPPSTGPRLARKHEAQA